MKHFRILAVVLAFLFSVACASDEPVKESPYPGIRDRADKTHKDVDKDTR
ncbi:MAG: hypothetical protein V3S46_06465 [Nitrospinota bacterium]